MKEKKLENLPIERETLLNAGVDLSEKGRSGTYLQMDHEVFHAKSLFPGLEVLSIDEAQKKYDWLKDYHFNLIDPLQDEYTKEVYEKGSHGYFLRALPGVKATYPLQACLFMQGKNVHQNVHNVIIAEEDSDLQIITGCATSKEVGAGVHIGISEFYVKKGARITFTMIHNWAEEIVSRPRSAVVVEDQGVFLSNYICLNPVKDLQMYPRVELKGEESLARFNSLLFAHEGSLLDVGSRVILSGKASKAEVISRAVSAGGKIVARGHLKGEAKEIKAHLECGGLLLNDRGVIHAIPELEGSREGIDLSHEASVGKIAKEEIEYLMARGLSSSEAQAAIVRGFLDTSIMGLPKVLQKQVDDTILTCEKDMF